MNGRNNVTLEQQDQAYDRAHRFGQTRDVNIYKLMIPDTVETRILQVSVRSALSLARSRSCINADYYILLPPPIPTLDVTHDT